MKLKSSLVTLTSESRLHRCDIPIIGLTGGIATGKSTASAYLEKMGLKVICADKLIKEIYQLDETILFIEKNFPEVIDQKKIDFKKLRAIAFAETANREKLEQFLYAKLPQQFKKSYDQNDQLIIYDVPLLFEKKLDSLVDYSLVIFSPRETQIERLTLRDHIDTSLAKEILANQMDIEQKRTLATHVIDNIADIQTLEDSLRDWISEILD